MPIKTYTSAGEYDLVWDSDKLTATVNGKIYNVIKGYNKSDLTEAERRMLSYSPLASYQAREVYTPGVGKGMSVIIRVMNYGNRSAHEYSYTLSIGEHE